MIFRTGGFAIAIAATIAAVSPAVSQQVAGNIQKDQTVEASPVLTLDQERWYQQSEFGIRVAASLKSEIDILSEENRKIDEALTDEEKRLTEERAAMEPADFRLLAIDFDERVTAIRRAQASKTAAIQQRGDAERTRFFELALPVLVALVKETGAVAILNSNAVIFSIRNIDITNVAIARVNAVIGQSTPDPATGPSPVPRPSDQP